MDTAVISVTYPTMTRPAPASEPRVPGNSRTGNVRILAGQAHHTVAVQCLCSSPPASEKRGAATDLKWSMEYSSSVCGRSPLSPCTFCCGVYSLRPCSAPSAANSACGHTGSAVRAGHSRAYYIESSTQGQCRRSRVT